MRDVVRGLVVACRKRAPDLERIEASLRADGAIEAGAEIVNDHIAFRTFGAPRLGIASLAQFFLRHGYIERDAYVFAAKHLDARWYAPPDDLLPRVFISELRIGELPLAASALVHRYVDTIKGEPLENVDLDDASAVVDALASPPWTAPRAADYEHLLGASEYAAWTLVNGYALNHLTISVHGLRADLQTVAALNAYLTERGIVLNDAGGAVKSSPDGLLVQSSTRARSIETVFGDGARALVAGSYVEFAERRVLPAFAHLAPEEIRREHRRDGFEAANADRIFESTDLRQRSESRQ